MRLQKMFNFKCIISKPMKKNGNYEKLGNFTNEAIKSVRIPGVTIVRNHKEAESVIRKLYDNSKK